ncbi:hypothetical protein MLD38_028502 [Melastoma candidum]|uniref:Uncharacterized protein n=1 Tax=Melastoma candidum TaxID=119954 RepID=A0ACB9N744_9MYRT|nr:hypothetical protein MLD38_028502 [Melastoma candidum]
MTLLLAVEEGQGGGTRLANSPSADSVSHDCSGIKERNYLGLSECSSVDSCAVSGVSDENKSSLNLKATELRLGLPGSQSPERDLGVCSGKPEERPLFPLLTSKDGLCSLSMQKNLVSGNKRGFTDAINELLDVKNVVYTNGSWIAGNAGVDMKLASRERAAVKEAGPKSSAECSSAVNRSVRNPTKAANNAPAAKAQVIGWPPIRSFRKNTLATTSKDNEEVDGKPGPGSLFVKVSMDGAPYLRKVDLRNYASYPELSSSLEKMFSGFTIGQCGSESIPGKGKLNESKLRDLLLGSEYVLTYEDKDGDWMLVGDVPWEMFIESCKRLKIMKGSEAIGLAPGAAEKPKIKI